MNKIAFIFLSAALFSNCFSQSVENTPQNETETSDAKQERDKNNDRKNSGRDAFRGGYVAAGLIQSGISNDLTNVENTYTYDGPGINVRNTVYPYIENHLLGELATNLNVRGVSSVRNFNCDGTTLSGFEASGLFNKRVANNRSCKLGGSASVGYGAFLNDNSIYLGVDLSIDYSSNKKHSSVDSGFCSYGVIDSKIYGFTPSFAARIGIYSELLDSLLYIRVGAAYVQSEAQAKEKELVSSSKVKLKKLSPLVGFGIERMIASSMFARLEFDYKFQTEKSDYFKEKETIHRIGLLNGVAPAGNTIYVTHSAKMRLRTKGYVIRIMLVYRPQH
ncbi:MAG: porin family protein [Holosporaceae bacterium]|jgi:hypothetical protein|nr:porin family protein [Holosporaceae bacterium]